MGKVTPVFRGSVDEEGRLQVASPRELKAHLRSLARKTVFITIEREGRQRSLPQNRYLWGVVYELIARHTGHTPEEIHDILKAKFLRVGVDFRGQRYEVVRSTTALDTLAFEDYLEKCRAFAAQELGVIVPLPNEAEIEINPEL